MSTTKFPNGSPADCPLPTDRRNRGAFGLLLAAFVLISCATVAARDPELVKLYLGTHPLTLQWLDNGNSGNRGRATVSERDGALWLEGSQEELYQGEKNYLKIAGRLEPVSAQEFDLEGTIETRVSFINQGKAYLRNGKFRFKAWGKRPYWRMQNDREQPDGPYPVTDYIDLHFGLVK